MAAVESMLTENLRHIEVYTMDGLLSLFWHGSPEAKHVVLACGGAMGGVLGPAEALYQELGVALDHLPQNALPPRLRCFVKLVGGVMSRSHLF